MSGLLAADIIRKPVISEKSMDQTQHNKYTFQVHDRANKLQIKDAIEELFKVHVVSVNVLTEKAHEKRRGTRRGRVVGYTSEWRKAIVTIAAGEKIEFFEGV
jgi:large subunit ribosomal protein L23